MEGSQADSKGYISSVARQGSITPTAIPRASNFRKVPGSSQTGFGKLPGRGFYSQLGFPVFEWFFPLCFFQRFPLVFSVIYFSFSLFYSSFSYRFLTVFFWALVFLCFFGLLFLSFLSYFFNTCQLFFILSVHFLYTSGPYIFIHVNFFKYVINIF